MNRLIYFLTLFFMISQLLLAEESGVPLAVDVSNRPTMLTLDFSTHDYELILYSFKMDETDYNRTFNFVVTGTFGASKPPVFYADRPAHRALLTDRDRLEYQLRQSDCAIACRLQQTGGYQPVAAKTAVQQQIGSTRQYVFSFGNAENDTTITATLVATSARAHGYLDISDTGKLHTARIQSHLDHFSTEAYPIATSIFGTESDVDNDGKVHFLYTSMVDNVNTGSADVHPVQSGDREYPSHNVSGIAGFYTIRSVLPQNRGGNGNMADLMYLSPTISSQAFYQSLLAHEFQHLISCNQHVLLRNGHCEESWLNEAMSHVCEDLIGRHTQGGNRNLISRYRDEPHHYSLTGPALFSTGIRGAAYLFARSLMEDFGTDVLSRLVQTANVGIANVEHATGESFHPIFDRHLSRLFLSGKDLNNTLNYTAPFLQNATSPKEFSVSPETPSVRLDIKPLSVAYLRLTSNQQQTTFNIFTDAEGDFRAQLIPIPRSGSIAPSPDFDGNGRVGFPDFVLFAGAYGTRSGQANFDSKFDLDGDGRIGFSDFVLFANAYGKPVSG
ncbi:MAG: hypothetical protein OXI23_12785 [Gemmatimonadota bacterium]|nr:hypothetical protein [Gemmatimonadota bacterium]